jgi:hypothetical protein
MDALLIEAFRIYCGFLAADFILLLYWHC